tara:strand:+ start:39 stop:539 length:501 start_codon:yes stop_codon:yes gene_type:complete
VGLTTLGYGAMKAGTVIQTVNTTFTDKTAITAQSYTSITNASLAITPKFSNSLIKITASICCQSKDTNTTYANCGFQFKRGSTVISQNPTDGAGPFELGGNMTGLSGGPEFNIRPCYVITDTPSTTSATTYSIEARIYHTQSPTLTINHGDSTTGQSTIVLEEIRQ